MAYISFQPKDHFNTKLYTGTGSSQVLTGVGFQPDFIWTKTRNEAEIHCLNTTVQGINNYLRSNDVDTLETSGSNITAQSSDGYTVGTEDRFNQSSNTFVSWNWKANGQGSSNTDGSINTTYTSANTTSGFSISTYTGTGANATVGHGLGAAPKVVLIKQTNGTAWWFMYHNDLGTTGKLNLNSTGYNNDLQASYWNSTAPSSSVFSLGTEASVNGSSQNFVAYCFAEKTGFSKFGSYTGNGNADGPMIYTGFKPAFVMVKNTATTSSWYMYDNKRPSVYNPNGTVLFANESTAESTNIASAEHPIDFLSNGFKIRTTSSARNGNGNKIIFMCFAEAPLVGSNNVPANAR